MYTTRKKAIQNEIEHWEYRLKQLESDGRSIISAECPLCDYAQVLQNNHTDVETFCDYCPYKQTFGVMCDDLINVFQIESGQEDSIEKVKKYLEKIRKLRL